MRLADRKKVKSRQAPKLANLAIVNEARSEYGICVIIINSNYYYLTPSGRFGEKLGVYGR